MPMSGGILLQFVLPSDAFLQVWVFSFYVWLGVIDKVAKLLMAWGDVSWVGSLGVILTWNSVVKK